MSYRLVIGQTLSGSNIVVDPTFSTADGVNWDSNVGANGAVTLQYAGGVQALFTNTEAVSTTGDWAELLTKTAILVKNTKYHVILTVASSTINFSYDDESDTTYYAYLECFIGNISIFVSQLYIATDPAPQVFEFDMWCQADSKFIIRLESISRSDGGVVNSVVVDSCYIYPYVWNTASSYYPDVKDMNIKISSSELFENFITNYSTEVVLYDDAYDYVLAQGIGRAIDVKLESNYTGAWTLFKQGVILTNDCVFERQSVTCKIEDIVSIFMSEKLNTDLTFKMHIGGGKKYLTRHYTDPSSNWLDFHDTGTGAYGNFSIVWYIWKLLRDYINELSQGLIVFDSDYFLATDGNFAERLALAFGEHIAGYGAIWFFDLTQSFNGIYNNLNKILNIGGYVYYNNGWIYRIEPISELLAEAVVSKYNTNNIRFTYDPKITPGGVQIGYTEMTNIYTDGAMTYTSIDTKYANTGEQMNLICDWVRDSQMINVVINPAPGADYEQNYYIFQYDVALPYNQTTDFGAIDNVDHGYNGDIVLSENMKRRLTTLSSAMTYKDARNTIQLSGTMTFKRIYEFSVDLSETEINTFLNNPYTRLRLINAYHATTGIVQELEWNLHTHIATIKLLGT